MAKKTRKRGERIWTGEGEEDVPSLFIPEDALEQPHNKRGQDGEIVEISGREFILAADGQWEPIE